MVSKEAKDWTPYEGIIMSIDPAGRGRTRWAGRSSPCSTRACSCWTPGASAAATADNLQALAVLARRYKVSKIIVEPNFGDGMFNKLLAPVVNKVYPAPSRTPSAPTPRRSAASSTAWSRS
jgi:hypothetical protein